MVTFSLLSQVQKGYREKIFLIGHSLNTGNEGLLQNTTCCEPWATSRRTGPVHQYHWISLSLLPLFRNLHKFPCSEIFLTSAFLPMIAPKPIKELFTVQLGLKSLIPHHHTHTLTLLYLQITNFLYRHELHTCTYKSQHSRVLSAVAGAAWNAACNHRCVDS